MLAIQGLICPATVAILKTTTAAPGTDWVAVGNANTGGAANVACKEITVLNLTGTTLSFAYGSGTGVVPSGESFELPDGSPCTFRGLNRNLQLLVKRTDESNTPVSFKAIAEGV